MKGKIRSRVKRSAVCLALAAILLATWGCGRESAPTVGPPAPPPFRPQSIQVELGTSGSLVTLMTAPGGGFTLNGEAFVSGGEVSAENGNLYELLLSGGTWTASFKAPDPIELALGASGESVLIAKNEDATFRIGEMQLEDGDTVSAANGSRYLLSRDMEGIWTAAYRGVEQLVALGMSGESVTVSRNEDATFRIGEMQLEDGGIATAMNGSRYLLSRDMEGVWTAAYRGVEQLVALGMSGESVTVSRNEDATFRIGETQLEDGGIATAMNGSRYLLSRDMEGVWTAAYEGVEQLVALGMSGESVTVSRNEDATFRIGETQLEDGGIATAMNGSRYLLSRDMEGVWTAAYEGVEQLVALGMSGDIVALLREEDGGYTRDGSAFSSGTRVRASNGSDYTLLQGADDIWTATLSAPLHQVYLGESAMLTLTQREDGTWTDGTRVYESGNIVFAPNGSRYRLVLRDGVWTGWFLPRVLGIAGTNLIAVEHEDGLGWVVPGSSAVIPKAGAADVHAKGASYRVWAEGLELRAERFDKPPHGTGPRGANYQIGRLGGATHLGQDDVETARNEAGTTLEIGGAEFSIGDLLESGMASAVGTQVVVLVREAIAGVRGETVSRIEELSGNSRSGRIGLRETWDMVRSALDRIFAPGEVELDTITDYDETLKALDALLIALSSERAFQDATAEDGGGVLAAAALSAERAADIFGVPVSESTARLGAVGDTRFGAVVTMARENGNAGDDLTTDAEGSQLGAFAYATIQATGSKSDIQLTGTALYRGKTVAVTGVGSFYQGDIRLEVDFGGNRVDSSISNLADRKGAPWKFSEIEVDRVLLPDARLLPNASWADPVQSDDFAWITLDRPRTGQGVPALRTSKFSFSGHLLGSGDEAGSQAVGVWSIGEDSDGADYIVGGFGADRAGSVRPSTSVATEGISTAANHAPVESDSGIAAQGFDALNAAETVDAHSYAWNARAKGAVEEFNPSPIVEAGPEEVVHGTHYPGFGSWAMTARHNELMSHTQRLRPSQDSTGVAQGLVLAATHRAGANAQEAGFAQPLMHRQDIAVPSSGASVPAVTSGLVEGSVAEPFVHLGLVGGEFGPPFGDWTGLGR